MDDNIIEMIDEWNFEIFDFEKNSSGKPLLYMFYYALSRHGLVEAFEIDLECLSRFLLSLEKTYHKKNPYHNSTHAADVVQTVNAILKRAIFKDSLSPLHKLAALFAAAIHDCDHPGVNNHFLIRTKSPLATMYNDRSVLENHHVSVGFSLLYEKSHNFLDKLSEEEHSMFRALVIDLVLATDFAQHFALLSDFSAKVCVWFSC